MIKVLLVDDHTVIRDGLRVILEMNPEIQVVGEATDGEMAVNLVCELKPDIVVMDISMPKMNGIDAARQIGALCPKAKVIILSMLGTSEHVFQALRAGAQGYLLKNSAGKEIAAAVVAVEQGKRYLSEQITNTLVGDYLEVREMAQDKSPLESLSQREREIMILVVQGKSSAEIGKSLFLSPKTVETYRSRLMQKLDVKDLAGLIKFALQNDLMALE
jgi:DNA-binding NarL/FixJ family response regulator